MKVDTKIIERLNELISLGEKALATRYSRSNDVVIHFGDDGIDTSLSQQFGTSSISLLSRVFGEDSQYFRLFNGFLEKFHDYTPVKRGIAVLKAAKDDYENGYLFNTKSLIEAEVFDDFLEQAEQLFAKGYHAPAAVVAGCVLEDGLKKLCAKNGITLAPKATMNPANDELAKAGVYNTLVQKKVLAMADLRNKAAHGQWTEFTKEDVGEMIKSVRSFLETHYV